MTAYILGKCRLVRRDLNFRLIGCSSRCLSIFHQACPVTNLTVKATNGLVSYKPFVMASIERSGRLWLSMLRTGGEHTVSRWMLSIATFTTTLSFQTLFSDGLII